MITITLTCRKSDTKKFTAPKFGEFVSRERNDLGIAQTITRDISNDTYTPNGIYNIRHLRRVNPDLSKLSGLALFLAENLNGSTWASIHGQNACNPYQSPYIIKLTSKYTQPEIWIKTGVKTPDDANAIAECFNLMNKPATLNGYLLPIIETTETDENYFIRVADEIQNIDNLKNSVASVEINGKIWEA